MKSISLEVGSGEFIAIVGPSGCGKTTLLKLIGGFIEPTGGEILIGGKSAEQARLNKEFGFVFQKPVLLPWRTIQENVYLPLEVIQKDLDKSRLAFKTEELLKLVGLVDFKNNYPREISGGMQQKVAIARALVFNPKFLLMDEPFSSIDEITRDFLNLELLRIWDNLKPTVLFVTHCISEAVFLADRVVVLSERPSKVKSVFKVQLPRPRCLDLKYTSEYSMTVKTIHDSF